MRGGNTAEIFSINGRKGGELVGYINQFLTSWPASGIYDTNEEMDHDFMKPKAESKAEAENGTTLWITFHTSGARCATTDRETAKRWVNSRLNVYEMPSVKVFKP